MADPKSNRAVNGAHTAEKTPTESKAKVNGNASAATSPPVTSPASLAVSLPEKASKQSKFQQMLALVQEVAKDSEAIGEYEKSIEGRNALEKDLAHKEGEVQKLRDFNNKIMRELADLKASTASQNETLVTAFEQRYKVYDTNKTAVETMQAEVTEVKVKLEAAKVDARNKQAEVEKLAQKLKDADKHAKAQGHEIKELNAESELQKSKMETAVTELATCKSKLADARADLGDDVLHEYDSEGLRKLGLELKALSKKCHNLALEFFNDPEGAKDSVTEIAELKDRFPNIPLSTASTKTAAKLRCATAEAVIANILITQIFTPFYLPPDAKAAATSLLEFFGEDERRRAVYRCQVILAHQARGEEAARIEEDIVRRATSEVKTTLHALVSVEKQPEFYASNAVPGLFRDALKLWSEVQRARDPMNAEKPELSQMLLPEKCEEYDPVAVVSPRSPRGMPAAAANTSASIPKGSTIAAVLFPQVTTRDEIIFNGVVLWSHQTEVPPPAAPASAPAAVQKTPSATVRSTPPIVAAMNNGEGGGGRRHQRRRSVVTDEVGSFKGKQNGHGGATGGASVATNGI